MDNSASVKVCGRACVVKDGKLLLVNNSGNLWYLPGGHMEAGETVSACAKRELYEETGYEAEITDLVYLYEFYDKHWNTHKVECCFNVRIIKEPSGKWADLGEDKSVTMAKFFSLEEIKSLENVHPLNLKDGKWLESQKSKTYLGFGESE